MISVGIIDTVGFVGSVNALDTCLKTADVEFVRFEKMSGGIVSIVIKGDVAAVSASIAAGVEAAKSVGEYRKHTIIARLDDQTQEMLDKSVHHEQESVFKSEEILPEEILIDNEIPDENSDHEEDPDVQERSAEIAKEKEATPKLSSESEIDKTKNIKTDDFEEVSLSAVSVRMRLDHSEESLNDMTVSNLRKLAREMNLKNLNKERIKRSRKSVLIENILKELKEEEE